MMMSKLLFIGILAGILAACTGVQDPYTAIGEANGRILATQAKGTELAGLAMVQAIADQAQAAQLQAQAQGTKQELDNRATGTVQAAQVQATGTLQALEVTKVVGELQATSTAGEATSQVQGLRIQGTSTAQAIALGSEIDKAKNDLAWREFWRYTFQLLIILASGLAAYFIYRLVKSYALRWEYVETLDGTTWKGPAAERPLLLTDIHYYRPRPQLTASQAASVVARSVDDRPVLQAENKSGGGILRLVLDGIVVAGDESKRLPGHRDLEGWSGPTWHKTTAILKYNQAVETGPGGTKILEPYHNLKGLLQAIQTNQIKTP